MNNTEEIISNSSKLSPVALGLIVEPPTIVLCYDLCIDNVKKRRKRKMPLRNFTDRTNVTRFAFALRQRHPQYLQDVLPITLEKMLRAIQEVLKGLEMDEALAKVEKEFEINPEENFNLLPTEELVRKKEIMDENFIKNLVKPDDPNFVYDKVVEFDKTSCQPSAWDDNEESSSNSPPRNIGADEKLSTEEVDPQVVINPNEISRLKQLEDKELILEQKTEQETSPNENLDAEILPDESRNDTEDITNINVFPIDTKQDDKQHDLENFDITLKLHESSHDKQDDSKELIKQDDKQYDLENLDITLKLDESSHDKQDDSEDLIKQDDKQHDFEDLDITLKLDESSHDKQDDAENIGTAIKQNESQNDKQDYPGIIIKMGEFSDDNDDDNHHDTEIAVKLDKSSNYKKSNEYFIMNPKESPSEHQDDTEIINSDTVQNEKKWIDADTFTKIESKIADDKLLDLGNSITNFESIIIEQHLLTEINSKSADKKDNPPITSVPAETVNSNSLLAAVDKKYKVNLEDKVISKSSEPEVEEVLLENNNEDSLTNSDNQLDNIEIEMGNVLLGLEDDDDFWT